MKNFKTWLGENIEFEDTLGQAIAKHEINNLPGGYIYDDGFINLTADPEIPIKGLIILGTSKHVFSMTEFSKDERYRIIDMSTYLINALHEIGFEKIISLQDEGTSGQFHIWFLPRHEWTLRFHNNLDDMINYSKNTLNTSEEYKQELLKCIELLKAKFIKYKY